MYIRWSILRHLSRTYNNDQSIAVTASDEQSTAASSSIKKKKRKKMETSFAVERYFFERSSRAFKFRLHRGIIRHVI